jgi:citrate synthase
MRGPEQLYKHEDTWITSMGGCFPENGQVILRDKDLFQDLKDISWMALLIYSITGRIPDQNQLRLFNGIWTICTSYPDPRLWNNRIATLAATSRSTATLGVSGAIAVSEAIIYGHRPMLAAMDFLLQTMAYLDNGIELGQFLIEKLNNTKNTQHGRPGSGRNRQIAILPGYGRPIIQTDERIKPLMELAEDLGYAHGSYVKLAFRIEKTLLDMEYNLHMNIAALIAALAADQSLTPGQFYYYIILCFCGGMIPCALDASKQSPGTFFPLRCDRIHYEGKATRYWK